MAPPEIIGMGEEIKDWHEVKRNGSKMIFLFPDILLSLFVLNFMPIEYIRPPRLCPISFFYSRNIFEIKMLISVHCTVRASCTGTLYHKEEVFERVFLKCTVVFNGLQVLCGTYIPSAWYVQ